MKILFLDQSGKPGGAELCLLDIAQNYRDRCLVGLFADGEFRQLLQQQQIPVQVLSDQPIAVRKHSGVVQGLLGFGNLIPLIAKVARMSRDFDVIYANTQKALVIGAIASALSRRPLVYHLHDILSSDHFSPANLRAIMALANRATLVIANSQASQAAFIAAGGKADRVRVVYNGFLPETYQPTVLTATRLRQQLDLEQRFVVGHFSRLSPWKGQHILLEALTHCPGVTVLFVGDALFGEAAYVAQLRAQVEALGLGDRVKFLGFRQDVPDLIATCDLITHTSTAPEPFGRVIVEAMLSGKTVVATAAGGAIELVEPGTTGWLTPPNDALKLAEMINHCRYQPAQTAAIALQAQQSARQRFNLAHTNQQLADLLEEFVGC
jgi:glycosyltransferase involved in cell wall biosynthesis